MRALQVTRGERKRHPRTPRGLIAACAGLGLLLAACGHPNSTEEAGAADEAETSTPQFTAECQVEEPVTIRYSHIFGPGAALVDAVVEKQQEIEGRTGGGVTFDNYYGASLLGALDNLPGVGDGRADAAQIVSAYHPAEVPLWNIGMVSGLAPNSEAKGRALDELARNNEALQAELERVNLKVLAQNPGSGGPFVIATREPVERLEDLEGMRIRLPGGFPDMAYDMLGVNPVSISPEEAYESIQRGVVDGVYFPLDVVVATGTHEVAPHILVTGVGTTGTGGVGMNLDLWNSLDSCVQGVFEDVFSDYIDSNLDYVTQGEDKACQTILDAGGSARVLPDEDQQRIKDILGDALVEPWKKQALDTGLAPEVVDSYLDEFRTLYAKYEAEATYVDGGVRCAEKYEASSR